MYSDRESDCEQLVQRQHDPHESCVLQWSQLGRIEFFIIIISIPKCVRVIICKQKHIFVLLVDRSGMHAAKMKKRYLTTRNSGTMPV